MKFEIINVSFFNEIVRAVCLTFLHSLWQGVVAAVLAGAFLMLTRKSRPAFRYNVLVGLLGVLLLVNAVTFLILYPKDQAQISGKVALAAKDFSPGNMNANAQNEFAPASVLSGIIEFCNANASVILTIWLFIFLWKSCQATAGLLHLNRIRKTGIHAPSNEWKDVFADLTRKLGITRRLQFFESENVMVPMVVGYAKPMVLVPLGMLAGMPAAQVEAILLHELAHIRRRDYLVNLIQIFCENIYFFNPAILWISHLIREEREHCCDDLAIEVSENRASFIHALVSFQEYNLSGNLAQLTFSRKRNHLLDRIKRIINHNNKSLDAMEKLFVTLSLVAAVGLSAAISPKTPRNGQPADHHRIYSEQLPAATVIPPLVIQTDTLPKKRKEFQAKSDNVYSQTESVSTYDLTLDDTKYVIVKKNGKLISLDVDGKEIPASDYGKYADAIARIEKKIKEEHEKAEKQRAQADVFRAEADVHRKEAEKVRFEAEKFRAEADVQRKNAADVRAGAEQFRKQAELMREQAEAMRKQAEQLRKEADKLRLQADKQREDAEVIRKEAEKTREQFEKKQAALIDDLLQTGVIKDIKKLSYVLSSQELVVNGEKQSADLQKKLAAKYLEGENVEMVYNYKGRTGYTFTGTIHSK